MNKNDSRVKLDFSIGSAADLIREAISKKPKMDESDKRIVAKNMDIILKKAKKAGVKMYEVAENAGLGGKGEKNPKHLRPYRLSKDSSNHKLIVQAHLYVNLIEAIAAIPSHQFSGASDDLIRELFSGSSYGLPREVGAEVKIELKAMLEECVRWMNQHLNLTETYQLLERLEGIEDGLPHREKQIKLYEASRTSSALNGLLENPELPLGREILPIKDANEEIITASDADGNEGQISYVHDFFINAGPNETGEIKPIFVAVPSLILRFGHSRRDDAHIMSLDDDWDHKRIKLRLSDGGEAYITEQTLARTIDLASFDTNEVDERNPILEKYLDANDELYEQEFSHGEEYIRKDYYFAPITLDFLDALEKWLDETDTSSGVLNFAKSCPPSLRYGSSNLARLAHRFIDPWIQNDLAKEYNKDKFLDWYKPPGGWLNDSRQPEMWIIPDIWWTYAKNFKIMVDAVYKGKSQNETEAYMNLLSRLKD